MGKLSAWKVRPLLESIGSVSDFVLELAATIQFLRVQGGIPDQAVEETKKRKALIAREERMERALSLLRELGLQPNPVSSH